MGQPAINQPETGPSGRLLQAQPQLVDHLLAHQKFLDLAGDRHREAVDEFHIARDLVVGDLALKEGADFLMVAACRRAAGSGAEFLAVARIRHADYLDVLDLGMAIGIPRG